MRLLKVLILILIKYVRSDSNKTTIKETNVVEEGPAPNNLRANPVTKCPGIAAPDYCTLLFSTKQDDPDRLSVGEIVTFFCNRYFELHPPSPNYRVCQSNGTWTHRQPNCQVKAGELCAAPTLPARALSDSSQITEWNIFDTFTMSCPAGYMAQGNATAQCNDKKIWVIDFQCDFTCASFVETGGVEVKEGKKEGDYYQDDKLVLQCKAGYKGSGNTTALCTDQSQGWETDFSCCVKCPALKNHLSDVGYCVDESITMEHEQKYFQYFQFTCLNCTGTLEWHFSDCQDSNCPVFVPGEGVEIIEVTRAEVNIELTSAVIYTDGDAVSLGCKAGYRPSGRNTATCHLPGLWSTNFTCCTTCTELTGPDDVIRPDDVIMSPDYSQNTSHTGFCAGESITLNSGELVLSCFECGDQMEWHLDNCQDTRLKLYQSNPEYLYLPAIGLLLLVIFVLSGVILKLRHKLSHQVLSVSADMVKIKPVKEPTIFSSKIRRPNRVSSESSDDFRMKSPRRVINIPICNFSSTATSTNKNSRRFSEVSF